MDNKLCTLCMNSCKQDETAKIVRCPKFQKKVSQKEFNDLISDLKKMENEAESIKSRTSDLIKNLRENSLTDNDLKEK